MSKWEDIGILTQVLATSQQEYLDSLKRQRDVDEGDISKPSTSR